MVPWLEIVLIILVLVKDFLVLGPPPDNLLTYYLLVQVPDEAASKCTNCKTEFSAFIRRVCVLNPKHSILVWLFSSSSSRQQLLLFTIVWSMFFNFVKRYACSGSAWLLQRVKVSCIGDTLKCILHASWVILVCKNCKHRDQCYHQESFCSQTNNREFLGLGETAPLQELWRHILW
jgi:hypothetical protein